MASIERRVLKRRDTMGRTRSVVRYKVRYWDLAGRQHSETLPRLVDAERRKAEIELELSAGQWLDPRRGDLRLAAWAADWLPSRHDLRPTTLARLATTMDRQVLPKFGSYPMNKIGNADVRVWVAQLLAEGLSAATVRKAVFALRQCLEAAVEDRRIPTNPARNVPLPTENAKPPRYLTQREVERLAAAMPEEWQAIVLVGGYGGLRWGEAVGLTRCNVDVIRSRLIIETTAVEVRGKVHVGQQPKTRRSKRTVPVARSVMRRIADHLHANVGPEPDALVFTGLRGEPLFRSSFLRYVWRPAVERAGLTGFTFHGLRHSFVAILVAAGCNVREVSEWAGHNSVAFTLTRYGGLFPDGTEAAVDRLDNLLGDA